MTIDPTLLSILACPVCKAALTQPADDRLLCSGCGRAYPIEDDIPVLLVEAAVVAGAEAPRA
jgi:uncharacterized protein YbaR (Trm112 family)